MYAYESYTKGMLMGADGNLHEVSDEIWNEYMRSIWREEAAQKRDRSPVHSNKSDSPESERTTLPKVVSYERVTDAHGEEILPSHRSVEDEVLERNVREEMHDRLQRAMEELSPEDLLLLGKLYLERDGMSIREYAARYDRPRTTVQYQRTRLLKKLRSIMEREEGLSSDMIHVACGYNEG